MAPFDRADRKPARSGQIYALGRGIPRAAYTSRLYEALHQGKNRSANRPVKLALDKSRNKTARQTATEAARLLLYPPSLVVRITIGGGGGRATNTN